jgi:hypothetical protein
MTTTTDETVDSMSIAKNHRVTPPQPTGPRLLRREVWVEISEDEYPGFKAKLWVNYPRRLIDDLNQSEDNDLRKRALGSMVVAHNGWVDYDGTEFPSASETAFWDAIPDELAAALIALVNREAGKLALSLNARRTR